LCGGIIFPKIDLRNEYFYIQIRLGDGWKMTFKIKYGLYEWLIMPFRLTNALGIFIRLTNQVLWPFINKFVMIYFDGILVFNHNKTNHIEHLRSVLKVWLKNKLYVKLKKCSFMTNKLSFLGFTEWDNGVEVDKEKVRVICDWPTPKTVNDV
jgi:hypothetical protein